MVWRSAHLHFLSLLMLLLSVSHVIYPLPPLSLSLVIQQPDESFGMNVAGGVGGQVGDLPVYISAIRAESAVARSGKIQVSESS